MYLKRPVLSRARFETRTLPSKPPAPSLAYVDQQFRLTTKPGGKLSNRNSYIIISLHFHGLVGLRPGIPICQHRIKP
jgi:hypothetical protein